MDDGYVDFGTYHPQEAQQLFDAFIAAGVRFDAAPVGRQVDMPRRLQAFTMAFDPTVSITVHADDMERAMQIRANVFKAQV